MEILDQQLANLHRRKAPKEVLLLGLFEKMISNGLSSETVVSILSQLTPLSTYQLQEFGQQARKGMVSDHIGLHELGHI